MTTNTHEGIAHPRREGIELVAVLHAVSDPVRLRIVAALAGRPHVRQHQRAGD